MLIRLGELADKIVGRAPDGKRRTVRWPEELLDYKKDHNARTAKSVAGTLIGAISCMLFMIAYSCDSPGLVAACLFLGIISFFILPPLTTEGHLYWEAESALGPLLEEDCLTLRAAAFLTVGAMPEWLKTQMDSEPDSVEGPGWQKTRLAAEPYTVARAGSDYLRLMSRIEDSGGSFSAEPFPSLDCRLPDSLKEAVGKIILFLSSLPDSGEDPRMDVEEAVMDTIRQLAAIDGESFTAALHDAKLEELAKKTEVENKKRDAYNDAVLDAVNAAQAEMPDENDEACKTVLRGMEKLHRLSETGKKRKRAVEPALKAGIGVAVTPLSR